MDTKKYIIEIPDNTAWLQWVKVFDKDGHVYFDFKDPEDLTPYIEPDLDAVKKEVHDKCMSEAEDLAYKLYSPKIDEAYQRGLNDAWEAARKIACDRPHGGFHIDTKQHIFGSSDYAYILANYNASEAIEEIRQYEQEQDEIKVGNEVNGKCGRGIITKISNDGDHFNIMWENGSTGYYMIEDFKKTGKHFPEIAEVLRKMQEVRE